ncbi:MAG: glycosyltransferase family 9 protein [bacterium]
MEYRPDCFHFRGHIPCRPHKEHGVHCQDCPEFVARTGRILLIKLGAAGDVIRTTPLLSPLQRDYPHHVISWLTYSPELLPAQVDDPLPFDAASLMWARNTEFDLVINLDKDREACALAREVTARRRLGFTLDFRDGLCRPVTELRDQEGPAKGGGIHVGPATKKFLTGLFDDVNQACGLSYLQEIFAICGYEFAGEEYLLDRPQPTPAFELPDREILVGLNSGCGGRWTSRLWPEPYWRELAEQLQQDGYGVVFLGGPDEDDKNRKLAAATGAAYPGHFDLRTFIGLMDRCTLVVTAVTMAMHIALGLGKKLVLFNNIFNPHEFELYGRGTILAPEQPCTCFFQPRCSNEKFCLETLRPESVRAAVRDLLESA